MFFGFEIYEVKDRPNLESIIPYYVTYDLEFDMKRLRLSRATAPRLIFITNYGQVKIYVLKTFEPF